MILYHFYCVHYKKYIPNKKAFTYCFKRTPRKGKCKSLKEVNPGAHHGSPTIHRNGNGKPILHNEVGPVLAYYKTYAIGKEMDT